MPADCMEDIMTSSTITESHATGHVRPRPGPGYRVAPPAVDLYGPWVAVLDQQFAPGSCEWALGPEGALVPVPQAADTETQPRRKALGVRLGAILRR